jgi:S-formylglutathione hydrolase FrmB
VTDSNPAEDNLLMYARRILGSMITLAFVVGLTAQPAPVHRVTFKITVSDSILGKFQTRGRLFIFISENPYGHPRNQLWPVNPKKNHIYAKNIDEWKPGDTLEINAGSGLMKTGPFDFDQIPAGNYSIQVLWDQNEEVSGVNAQGNLYSLSHSVKIGGDQTLLIQIADEIPPRKLIDHRFVRMVEIQSDTLTAWWGKPISLKASLLLPGGYFDNPEKRYPVRYNVAGYGGRFNRVNLLVGVQNKFTDWWFSDVAPQIITVFLDGSGPFGDSYQLDSENNGPYGYALIHELIPYIENSFRILATPESRFVDGCSTGGWVSLALQIFYPDFFNGAYSYSPDPIDFENYQTINIYRDQNVFYNEWGNSRPLARDITGDPIALMKDFVQHENVQGTSNTYLNSGGQMSAHAAVYGPKGENGLPAPLFDPVSGEIDPEVAEHWKKYDLKLHLLDNWSEIGPKLQGKIWIWMGDMDNFILNPATRSFHEYLMTTQDPRSDAMVIFEPMKGHCWEYSHRKVLEMIWDKLNTE